MDSPLFKNKNSIFINKRKASGLATTITTTNTTTTKRTCINDTFSVHRWLIPKLTLVNQKVSTCGLGDFAVCTNMNAFRYVIFFLALPPQGGSAFVSKGRGPPSPEQGGPQRENAPSLPLFPSADLRAKNGRGLHKMMATAVGE